ncbi:hypothetical protein U1Q18_017794, partial [Sarracenia purpurea var. burkii]
NEMWNELPNLPRSASTAIAHAVPEPHALTNDQATSLNRQSFSTAPPPLPLAKNEDTVDSLLVAPSAEEEDVIIQDNGQHDTVSGYD